MVLYILRGAFILLATSVTFLYLLPFQKDAEVAFWNVIGMLAMTLGLTGAIIAADAYIREKKLASLSGVFLGLLAGLLVAYALSFFVDLIGLLTAPDIPFERPQTQAEYRSLLDPERVLLERHDAYMNLLEGVKVVIGLITCYGGISLVLQTKDDFRFVLPYVEFAKQVRGTKPVILDSSVLIDGRIVDVIDTAIMQCPLIVPKFVLNELQTVADSGDKLRRARGRRGLDMLSKLQANSSVQLSIDESDAEGATVDQKLLSLTEQLQAHLMTNDFNLGKIAAVRKVGVINLNELAKAMRPVALPGERMIVRVVKPGESANQGVGYLPDGTMVVVENARQAMHREIELTVTSTLQTSAGRMIFGSFTGEESDDEDAGQQPRHGDGPANRSHS